jgi:peptide/nickel transport system permease protein
MDTTSSSSGVPPKGMAPVLAMATPAASAPVVEPLITRKRRSGGFGWSGLLGLAVLAFWVLAAVFGPSLMSQSIGAMGGADVFAPMSAAHWLGTDYLGRDMLARVVDGSRYTVGIALVATMVASGIGTTLALLAAASSRWLDAGLSRGLDTLTAIPSKMFALLMVAGFGSSVPMLIATAAIIYVPGAYRIARSLAVNINAMDYVTVARTRGEGTAYVMLREILPNILGPMLADLGLRFVYVVLLLAGLSFLGLGVQPPTPSWGAMLSSGRNYVSTAWWIATFPGLCLFVLVLAANLLGDAVRDRLDPQSQRN